MNDNHNVNAWTQANALLVDDCAQLTFESVALDGALEPFARAQTHTRPRAPVRQNSHRQHASMRPSSPTIDGVKRFGQLESYAGRSGRADLRGPRYAGMSCQRPLRRRRVSVRCPPRVLIRRRNPCTCLRLRFDFSVRCFFMRIDSFLRVSWRALCGRTGSVASIISAARKENQGETA